jgi:hypothetical protein
MPIIVAVDCGVIQALGSPNSQMALYGLLSALKGVLR